MARLLDTDLWYKTFRLQKGARFVYQFATNLPTRRVARHHAVCGALRNDPLNPLQFAERWNEFNPYEATFFSAVELPSAEPQIWNVARSTVRKGRVGRENSRASSSATNVQFGFTLRTATLPLKALRFAGTFRRRSLRKHGAGSNYSR
jgi:enterochelin esterase family protein